VFRLLFSRDVKFENYFQNIYINIYIYKRINIYNFVPVYMISSYAPKWFRIDTSDIIRMDNISFEHRYHAYVPDHGRLSVLTYFFILSSYLTKNTVCLSWKRKWMLSSVLDFTANVTETVVLVMKVIHVSRLWMSYTCLGYESHTSVWVMKVIHVSRLWKSYKCFGYESHIRV